jgi:magnesium-transporting ATPase (P-type)
MSNNYSLEQYKIYLDMIERVSDRRMRTHNFFITITSAIISLLAVGISSGVLSSNMWFILIFLYIFILCICKIWVDSLNSFAKLNSVKFKIIFEVEKELPHRCLIDEWEVLKKDSSYLLLSENEKRIPKYLATLLTVAAIGYALLLLPC